MPVPTLFSQLSTTAASNDPANTEGVSEGDDHLRQLYAFVRSLYEGQGNGQVVFPSTQNPSSDGNTLDDYEEGTWTPTDISGASLSLTASGSYVKIGKQVFVKLVVVYPATANASAAVLGALPFTAAADSLQASIAVGYASTANITGGLVTSGATTIALYKSGTGTVTNAQLSGATVYMAGSYISNA